jgi:hypothetical protein
LIESGLPRLLFRFIQVTGRKTVFAVADPQDSLKSGQTRAIQITGISLSHPHFAPD